MKEDEIIENLKNVIEESGFNSWINSSNDVEILFILDKIFIEDVVFLNKIINSGKGLSPISILLSEIINLPFQTLNRIKKCITDLLLSYSINEDNNTPITNISWLVSETKSCCDELLINTFIKQNSLNQTNKYVLIQIITNLDPLLAIECIDNELNNDFDIDLFLLKLDVLAEVNPIIGLEEFIKLEYSNDNIDQIVNDIYFPIKEILVALIKESGSLIYLRSRINDIKDVWKNDLVDLVINENEELAIIMTIKDEEMLIRTLMSDIKFFSNREGIDKLKNHPLYSWKIVSSAIIRLIVKDKVILKDIDIESFSELILYYYMAFEFKFNYYLYNTYQVQFDLAHFQLMFSKDVSVFQLKAPNYLIEEYYSKKWRKPIGQLGLKKVLNERIKIDSTYDTTTAH